MDAEGSEEDCRVDGKFSDAQNDIRTAEKKESDQIDKGWAWVILTAGTIIIVLYGGCFKSFGIFFIEILAAYQGSVSVTSLTSGLQFVVYCFTAVPVLTFVIQRHSVRSCQLTGAFLSALGFGLSSFVPSLELLIFCQSVLCGIGNALVYPTMIVLIKEYFDRHLGLANGIMMSGYSLGGFCMPALIRYLVDKYGLYGALLLTAGILLNVMVPAVLLRPMSFYTGKSPKNNSNNLHSTNMDINIEQDDLEKRKPLESADKRENDFTLVENSKDSDALTHVSKPLLTTADQNGVKNESETNEETESEAIEMSYVDFHRLDILDGVSQSSIVKYLNSGDLVSMSKLDVRWTQSNTHVDVDQKTIGILKRTTLFLRSCKLLDKGIWRNKLFIILLSVYTFGSVGPESCHIFIPAFANDENLTDNSIAIVISLLCISDFFGRILSGFISDRAWIKRYQIVLVSQLTIACLTAFTHFFISKIAIFLFALSYGLFAGVIFAIMPSILANILGQELFPVGVAISIMIKGTVMGMAIPFMGFLRDFTGTYHATFYFMGSSSAVVVMSLFIFHVVSEKQDAKSNKDIDIEINIDQ